MLILRSVEFEQTSRENQLVCVYLRGANVGGYPYRIAYFLEDIFLRQPHQGSWSLKNT